jgi:cell division protease FtsH
MRRKSVIITAVIAVILGIVLIFSFVLSPEGPSLDYSDYLNKARNGEIKEVYVTTGTEKISVTLAREPEKRYNVVVPRNMLGVNGTLLDFGVPLQNMPAVKNQGTNGWLVVRNMLSFAIPIVFIVLLFLVLRRNTPNSQEGGGRGNPFTFGRSGAKLITPEKVSIRFSDVAGVEEAKQELQEVVEFLRHSEKFTQVGARIPKGVLLIGPPGTGKTMLAKAVAGEANVPFMSVSGSEFVDMFVGVGAARVRDLFSRAKKMAPCIIFVDEVDALARKRSIRPGGGTEEREQTLNQILVEMDGFDSHTQVIVIAATNRVDVLDPAFLRPGRFDRQVMVDPPDLRGRLETLKVHTRNKPLANEVDLERVAKQTTGFTGADLANLVNEAAIMAARRNKKMIDLFDLEEAIDRVVAGPERKSRVISERERIVTAYHEVGHALVAKLAGNVDPVQKISIISRGRMGGYTRVAAGEDRTLWTKSQLDDFMAFALGGHAAEELMFGEASTGPSNDIQRVSDMARGMVCEYGMSRLGTVAYGENQGGSRHINYSKVVAYEIDQEVNRLVTNALNRARHLLATHNRHLTAISNVLLEKEVINGTEMDEIFASVEREINADKQDKLVAFSTPGEAVTQSPFDNKSVDAQQAAGG